MSIFGKWTERSPQLASEFSSARPFQHVVIPEFFSEEVARTIVADFPSPKDSGLTWHHYDNPIEQKFALDDFSGLPRISEIFDSLQADETVRLLTKITGIKDLMADPLLHGAGLHAYPSGGKLDVHLDYCIHPISGDERRCNLIVYMNPDWKPEYNGELELWNESLTEKKSIIAPSFNTAVLFKTNDMSYHGLPRPLRCPQGEYRKSLAIYYVSPRTDGAIPRFRAEYHPTPEQKVTGNAKLEKLYSIRKYRRIEPEDLRDWPSWRTDGGDFW